MFLGFSTFGHSLSNLNAAFQEGNSAHLDKKLDQKYKPRVVIQDHYSNFN